jgi:hypothetical protein
LAGTEVMRPSMRGGHTGQPVLVGSDGGGDGSVSPSASGLIFDLDAGTFGFLGREGQFLAPSAEFPRLLLTLLLAGMLGVLVAFGGVFVLGTPLPQPASVRATASAWPRRPGASDAPLRRAA